jgi:hypothetical protein
MSLMKNVLVIIISGESIAVRHSGLSANVNVADRATNQTQFVSRQTDQRGSLDRSDVISRGISRLDIMQRSITIWTLSPELLDITALQIPSWRILRLVQEIWLVHRTIQVHVHDFPKVRNLRSGIQEGSIAIWGCDEFGP